MACPWEIEMKMPRNHLDQSDLGARDREKGKL